MTNKQIEALCYEYELHDRFRRVWWGTEKYDPSDELDWMVQNSIRRRFAISRLIKKHNEL